MALQTLGKLELFGGDDYTTFPGIRLELKKGMLLYAVLEFNTPEKYRGGVLINYAFNSEERYDAVTPPFAEIYDWGIQLGIWIPPNPLARKEARIVFGAKRLLYYNPPSTASRAFLTLRVDPDEKP